MILDFLTKVATNLAVTAADAYSQFSIDLDAVTPRRRVGTGEPIVLVFVVKVAGAGSTNTSDFMVVQSENPDLSSHDVVAQRRVANADLGPGALVEVPIPTGTPTKRYIGGRVELGTGDTVTVDAFLIPQSHMQDFRAYAKNYAV